MKKLRYILPILLVLAGSAGLFADIFPVPRDIYAVGGTPFNIEQPLVMEPFSDAALEEFENSGLKNALEKAGAVLTVKDPAMAGLWEESGIAISFGLLSDKSLREGLRNCQLQPAQGYPGPEGYILVIRSSRIILAGRDRAGLYFGLQSLIQLVKDSKKVACREIVDWPAYPMRAIYLAMEPGLSEEQYKEVCHIIQTAAALKYNQVCVEAGNGGYARLEMESSQPGRKISEVLTDLFEFSQRHHQNPRPEGHARFFPRGDYPHPNSYAGDAMQLEGIRTSETITLKGELPTELTIQPYDQKGRKWKKPVPVRQVLHDIRTGKTWDQEPLIIKSADGKTIYTEGKDYTVAYGKIRAHWFFKTHYGHGHPKGYPYSVLRYADYEDDREPTLIRRTADSPIPEGVSVIIEFTYISPDPYSRWKYRECLSDPRIYKKDRSNPVYRYCVDPFDKIGGELSVFGLEFDEYRSLGWDYRCLNSGKSRPRLWADFVKFHMDEILKKQPDIQVIMWSDMIDPAHNGDLYRTTGSAEMLAKGGYTKNLIAQPWHSGKADASIKYLAGLGYQILPSCQGSSGDNEAFKWRYFMDKYCGKNLAAGFQYTHWKGVPGWKALLGGEDAKEARGFRMVSQAAWSAAPHITLLPPVRQGNHLIVSARIQGDDLHYVPHGSSGEAVVANDAGAGGKGRVLEGPAPIQTVILHYWKQGIAESATLTMKLSDKKDIYTASLPQAANTSIGFMLDASDGFRSNRAPFTGWLTYKTDAAGKALPARIDVPCEVPVLKPPAPAGKEVSGKWKFKGELSPEWKIVFNDDFERKTIGPDWSILGGNWKIENGQLSIEAKAADKTIMCNLEFPGAQKVEFDAVSDKPCDLSGLLRSHVERGYKGGYFVGFGSDGNTSAKLVAKEQILGSCDAKIIPGQTYHIVCEIDGNRLIHSVDGNIIKTYELKAPLRGESHMNIGLYAWGGGRFDNLKVWIKQE